MAEDMNWLYEFAPCIPVKSNSVKVIKEPQQFYSKLKELTHSSRKRIVLSTLYIGTGYLELDLMDCLREALKAGDSKFRLDFLFDYTRGTRGAEKSCKNMVQKLVEEEGDSGRIRVSLYHTPNLRGLIKRVLPEKSNEIIGLQHMKIYIFDDSLLISGANLSDQYFVNRQDRYILIENCPMLADFYSEIVHSVQSSSFELKKGGKIEPHKDCNEHPYLGNYDIYCAMLRTRMENVIEKFREKSPLKLDGNDTVIFPLIQMGLFGIDFEDLLLRKVFAIEDPNLQISLSSGYFNLTEDYSRLILNQGRYKLAILTASPMANSFYNGHGLLSYVPFLYTHFSREFFDRAAALNRDIFLYEYQRLGWTFHAKGMWWQYENNGPMITYMESKLYQTYEKNITYDRKFGMAIMQSFLTSPFKSAVCPIIRVHIWKRMHFSNAVLEWKLTLLIEMIIMCRFLFGLYPDIFDDSFKYLESLST